MKIKSFKIFCNNNDKSYEVRKTLHDKLINNSFVYKEDNYDLAIAIGGDGSFLRMVKENNFDSNIMYVGVNAGTLGFAQEVSVDEIDDFIEELKMDDYKVEKIGILENKILTDNKEESFYALNEIVIRDKDLKTVNLDVSLDGLYIERFIGDGMLISTPFGSTAYNLSAGGSIIYNTFHAIQLTPIAPINNKSYKTLSNSVILPEGMHITLKPTEKNTDILVQIDGENKYYSDAVLVDSVLNKKRINCLRRKDYNFSKKINEKFLK